MQEELLLAFLFIALAVGWAMGVSMRFSKTKKSEPVTYESKKHRLQLLFDTYSDEALDSFINSLEVNRETLGLHISIGKHFRTEGEVEKAIFIHQNLMSHPEFSRYETEPVVYELAKDYKAAGLFDRAESLLEQLLSSKNFTKKSRQLLLDVYELEKEWLKAAELGEGFDYKRDPTIRTRVSHYWCELAEDCEAQNNMLEALRFYKRALKVHPHCVRANLALAKHSIAGGELRSAIQRLRTVVSDSPEFFEVALPQLWACTEQTGSYESFRNYLNKVYAETGNVNVLLAIFEAYLQENKIDEGFAYLERETLHYPSLSAVNALMQASVDKETRRLDGLWSVLTDVIGRIRDSIPPYRCEHCGFSGKTLHWMCPSCKSWETTKPYSERLGKMEEYL